MQGISSLRTIFYSLFQHKTERGAFLTDRSKKKHGFSTFLRGCNPVRPFGYRHGQLNQSTFSALN